MKKTAFALLLAIITFSFVFAGDVIKVLRVYNGGECTTVPLNGVDSITHIKKDVANNLPTDIFSSIVWTIDSIYSIPSNSIDSLAILDYHTNEYKAHIESVGEFISVYDGEGVEEFQKDIINWLNNQDWIQSSFFNDENDFLSINMNDGTKSFVSFQDASYWGDTDFNSNYSRASSKSTSYYDVTSQDDETIIPNANILYIGGLSMQRHLGADYFMSEIRQVEKIKSESPIEIELDKSIKSLSFRDYNLSNYGIIIITQTHGTPDGSFEVEDFSGTVNFYWGLTYLAKYMEFGQLYFGLEPVQATLVKPSEIASRTSSTNQIIYGNYCWSSQLANKIKNSTVFGYITKSAYGTNVNYYVKFMDAMLNGATYEKSIEHIKPYPFDKAEGGKVIPTTNKPDSKQRYFSISTDEITQRADNGNPIIKGKINGFNNLRDNLTYVAFCHEGADSFTPEDDDVIRIEVPANKIKSDGTFEFEFQSEIPLKSAIIYGFCFGFEYGDNTYYGETKLYGKLDGLEYEKKEEWCYVMSSEPTVLYSYDVTTHFETTKNQKDFWIALYSGDQLVATRPVKIEEGSNTQITSIEFGCTKEDFTFDYTNFKAKVENLYLTAITNVTINGELTGIVFNDPSEMVELEVTYEQKPDVRFTSVEVQSPTFSGNDALIGYIVQATSTGTLFIESVRLVTEGEYWEKVTHDAITDLISDNGLVSDYGLLTVYNYMYLNNAAELSSLIGYFEIKGPQLNTTSSNHIQFTSSNGKYITGARIVEGRRGAANTSRSIYNAVNYVATDRGVRSDELILQDGVSTLGVKNTIPERWKNTPIIKRK